MLCWKILGELYFMILFYSLSIYHLDEPGLILLGHRILFVASHNFLSNKPLCLNKEIHGQKTLIFCIDEKNLGLPCIFVYQPQGIYIFPFTKLLRLLGIHFAVLVYVLFSLG